MRIEKVVDTLCQRYRTRDPFKLAKEMNFIILYESLGGIRGYYNQFCKQKMIHINGELSFEQKRFTCAHEIGHAVLHPESNTPYLHANTLFPVGRYEKEANCFAIDLVYSDEDLQDYLQFSTPQIAQCLNLPLPLVEYRLSVIKKRLRFPV